MLTIENSPNFITSILNYLTNKSYWILNHLYVKEISLGNDKSYFDTNITSHHHFYDTKTNELIDIDSSKIELKNIPNPPKGKSIKEIDVVINVENDSQ